MRKETPISIDITEKFDGGYSLSEEKDEISVRYQYFEKAEKLNGRNPKKVARGLLEELVNERKFEPFSFGEEHGGVTEISMGDRGFIHTWPSKMQISIRRGKYFLEIRESSIHIKISADEVKELEDYINEKNA